MMSCRLKRCHGECQATGDAPDSARKRLSTAAAVAGGGGDDSGRDERHTHRVPLMSPRQLTRPRLRTSA